MVKLESVADIYLASGLGIINSQALMGSAHAHLNIMAVIVLP